MIPISFWKLSSSKENICSFGDIAVPSTDKPTTLNTALVSKIDKEILKEPQDFIQIWTDQGSGSSKDCSIWEMEPYPDYRCIGFVVTAKYSWLWFPLPVISKFIKQNQIKMLKQQKRKKIRTTWICTNLKKIQNFPLRF